jgi:uncharacterized membrane protein YhaH (DUF805 family)
MPTATSYDNRDDAGNNATTAITVSQVCFHIYIYIYLFTLFLLLASTTVPTSTYMKPWHDDGQWGAMHDVRCREQRDDWHVAGMFSYIYIYFTLFLLLASTTVPTATYMKPWHDDGDGEQCMMYDAGNSATTAIAMSQVCFLLYIYFFYLISFTS